MPSESNSNAGELELVSKREVAEQLLGYGIDPQQVAAVVRLPLKAVQAIGTFRSTTTLSGPDAELADAMRNLAWMAYEEAVYLMQFGSPADRIGLIKMILGRSMSLVGQEKSSRYEEMRGLFEEVMTGIRSPEELPFELPLDNDVDISAAFGDSNDSD